MLGTLEQLSGFAIEQQILKQIQARYAVVPTSAIRTNGNHGPRMVGGDRGNGARLPDAQIYGGRVRGWLEVKAKSAPNLWKNLSRYEHGFNASSIVDYRRIQETSKLPVYILVCESQTGKLILATIDTMDAAGKPEQRDLYGVPLLHYDSRAFALVGTCNFSGGNACRMTISWDWGAVNQLMGQLAFDFSGTEINA